MKKILVVGMEKVGSLVGTLLGRQFEVFGLDKNKSAVALNFPVVVADVTDLPSLRANLAGFDAVVSCMSYNVNLPIAKTACELGIHYYALIIDESMLVGSKKLMRALGVKATKADRQPLGHQHGQVPNISDAGHTPGMFLERIYKRDAEFVVYLPMPRQRTIAAF